MHSSTFIPHPPPFRRTQSHLIDAEGGLEPQVVTNEGWRFVQFEEVCFSILLY